MIFELACHRFYDGAKEQSGDDDRDFEEERMVHRAASGMSLRSMKEQLPNPPHIPPAT